MYRNDVEGICGPAAAAHSVMAWVAANASSYYPRECMIEKFYRALSPDDQGVDALEMFNLWRQKGLGLDGSDAILAYAAVDLKDQDEVEIAVHAFGGICVGLALPNFATHGDMTSVNWKLPWPWWMRKHSLWSKPNPANGHMVYVCGYTPRKVNCVTWGAEKDMTWAFLREYGMVGLVPLSEEDWIAQGLAPSKLDKERLFALLKQIEAN
jgi:hypothetical protein